MPVPTGDADRNVSSVSIAIRSRLNSSMKASARTPLPAMLLWTAPVARKPLQRQALAVRDRHARELVLPADSDVHRGAEERKRRDLLQRDRGLATRVGASVELAVEQPREE